MYRYFGYVLHPRSLKSPQVAPGDLSLWPARSPVMAGAARSPVVMVAFFVDERGFGRKGHLFDRSVS
jgi:hypothetical protein